jgi:hypothetical protein
MPPVRPIRLTDDELSAIFAACRPLPVERRDAFLREVAALLSGCVEVGPGSVYRAIEQAQRAHFDPPQFEHPHKYARRG